MSMRFALFLSIAMVFASDCLSQGTPENKSGERSIWEKPLPSVEFKELSVSSAVDQLIKLYRQQYPEDDRLSGYILVGPVSSFVKVTMSLKDVPFGKACHSVALASGWLYTLHGRSVAFFPYSEPYYTDTTRVMPLTPNVQRALKVPADVTAAGLLDALAKRHLDVSRFETVKTFDIDGTRYLWVTGFREEVETFVHLWKLLGREGDG